MSAPSNPAPPSGAVQPSTPTPTPAKRQPTLSERFARLVLIFFFGAVALFALFTWASLNYTFSEGERVGYARKLSRRGWVCKTWEGEIAMSNVPGNQESLFAFTVRDEKVVEQFRALEGKHVAVIYKERKGVPSSCFGDTPYHVHEVRAIK